MRFQQTADMKRATQDRGGDRAHIKGDEFRFKISVPPVLKQITVYLLNVVTNLFL